MTKYKSLKPSLLAKAEQEIIEMQRKIQGCNYVPVDLIAQTFDGKWYYDTTYAQLRFHMPYQKPMINVLREFLQTQLPDARFREMDWPGKPAVYYFEVFIKTPVGEIEFDMKFVSNLEGSTCVVKEIGTEKRTYESPIYEVICPEGAEEAAL